MFKGTVMKLFVTACLYIYLGCAIYYTFDNGFYIADTNKIAAAFVVALILDVIIIDTICAFIHSIFGKNDNKEALGNTSPI